MESLDLLSSLPEGCISYIISFTSPRDACRSSAVCSIFRSGSESDSVWERFLPPDYQDVLAGSVSPPVRFSSKKEPFFQLCAVLFDDNKMKARNGGSGSLQQPARRLHFSYLLLLHFSSRCVHIRGRVFHLLIHFRIRRRLGEIPPARLPGYPHRICFSCPLLVQEGALHLSL
ncbi:hypothetical protein MRB53_035477 [Persea americana]|uniref:Uncharacterized protein n=1 Tax=Persea americana TaxID=3435 RepID=A0ACC2K4Q7_PERAE|nr:hypothetical protein MRB53_035477 [Persea americana]